MKLEYRCRQCGGVRVTAVRSLDDYAEPDDLVCRFCGSTKVTVTVVNQGSVA